MKYLSEEKLHRCYLKWKDIIAEKQADPAMPISFHQGEPYVEEGYKYNIIQQGKDILDQFDWKEAGIIGSGNIVKLALDLLAICPNHSVQQNLVDYRDIMYLADQAYSSKLKDIEKGLYLLFVEDSYKDAFNLLAHALNKKYALISYFFFLKDSSKYQVVRPNNFAERFPLLGADPKCALNCSWENYQQYVSTLEEVRCFLNAAQAEEITLTDAHSFVWMLWMLSNK